QRKSSAEDAMQSMMRYFIMLMTAAVLLLPAVPSAAQSAPAAKPDLAVDKIYLNPSGHVVVEIRNAGPGSLPEKAWDASQAYTACFVIMIGVQFADYAALWAADPDRALKNPGGSITYTSTIRIQEPTRVRVWLDPTDQVEDASRANNVKEVLLKPEPVKSN
ncbi:MAG TPA: hypothetical protein VFG28_03180, partial [Syntrophales bacterium]|nr:hypothetical protein [Syntrophales bacterium]